MPLFFTQLSFMNMTTALARLSILETVHGKKNAHPHKSHTFIWIHNPTHQSKKSFAHLVWSSLFCWRSWISVWDRCSVWCLSSIRFLRWSSVTVRASSTWRSRFLVLIYQWMHNTSQLTLMHNIDSYWPLQHFPDYQITISLHLMVIISVPSTYSIE